MAFHLTFYSVSIIIGSHLKAVHFFLVHARLSGDSICESDIGTLWRNDTTNNRGLSRLSNQPDVAAAPFHHKAKITQNAQECYVYTPTGSKLFVRVKLLCMRSFLCTISLDISSAKRLFADTILLIIFYFFL